MNLDNINYLAGITPNQVTNPILINTEIEPYFYENGSFGFFQNLISKGITLVLVLGIVIFFFMLLFGGIQWISSGGDKASLEGARGKITNAIIGLVILLSTFAIVSLIELFFGINILTLDIGSLVIQ